MPEVEVTAQPVTSNGEAPMMFKPKPSLIDIESSDGNHKASVDLYDAWFVVDEAFKSPTQEARWDKIRNWIASKLGCGADQVSTTFCVEFNNFIQERGKHRQEQTKNKIIDT